MPVRKQYQPIGNIITNYSGVRTSGVIYQNTTGNPILVLATTVLAVDGSAGSLARLNARVQDVTPPVTDVGQVQLNNLAAGHATQTSAVLMLAVPQGYYYTLEEVLVSGGTTLMLRWVEVQLIAPFSAGF